MSVAATLAPAAPAAATDPIRVMIVDDAVVVRGLVSRWVDEEPGLKIVASLRSGREAADQLLRHNPDVVVLDIEMPDLDGLSALPLLLEKKRDLVVIMASTLTRRNAEVSLKALSLGAADYIPKPATNREVTTSATFRRDLIEKIRQLGARRKRAAADPRAHTLQRADGARYPGADEVRNCRAAQRRIAFRALVRHQAAAILRREAARPDDRLLHRRAPGTDRIGRQDRTGLRPR